MKKILMMIGLASAALTSAQAGNWYGYDSNGNYYWGNSSGGNFYQYDSNGNYYYGSQNGRNGYWYGSNGNSGFYNYGD